MKILVFILLSLDVTCNEYRQGRFQIISGLRIINSAMSTIKPSVGVAPYCCSFCLSVIACKSLNYNKQEGICELLGVGPYDTVVALENNADWIILYKEMDRELFLRATPDVGINVLDTWLGSNRYSLPAADSSCLTTATTNCTTHYRNPKIDHWADLSIKKVTIELYVDGIQMAFLNFNATDSDKESWMNHSRLINSSWPSLPSASFNYFSVKGHTSCNRSFFINAVYPGCENDAGWLVVIDSDTGCCTAWDYSITPKPKFLYSKDQDKTIYSNNTYGLADVFAIFVEKND